MGCSSGVQRIASCKLNLKTLDMPQSKRPEALSWSRFRPSKVVPL